MWWSKNQAKIWIAPCDKPLKIRDGETVLDVALRNKLDIGHACEGMGSCTTCRVFVEEGEPGERTEIEAERALERGFAEQERLACQIIAKEGLKLRLPD